MQFLTELVAFVLTAYLALINVLAVEIEVWFGNETNENIPTLETTEPEEHLSFLPSNINLSIPDILLRSSSYQQAANASGADLSGATTDNPLEAIVNIFCTFTTDDYIRTTTGTGFFIDPDGVILTNAHVAQFLLLEQTTDGGKTECVIRNGNPAAPRYHAELLYISPAWVQENASVMNDAVPMGTGERDYALLYASKTIDDSPLPAVFPALGYNTNPLPITDKNSSVLAAGYPATNLFKDGPSTDLIPRQATSTISELYTFGSNYADVFSIKGSVVGAEGSSGGPILNKAGQVIGIIVTRGDDTTDGAGSLRAITLSHIDRTITQETGFSFTKNLNGNLPYRANIFSETLSPFLITILQQAR